MGTQTIAATGGNGGGNSGGMQRPQIQSLSRQGSLYGLTLNEVQNHLGEPLHSMNLDELLKSVFQGEAANQGQGMEMEGLTHQYASGSGGLHRQGSITMPGSLSKKTVDDVWRDIEQGRRKKGPSNEDRRPGHERQPTLGEMTLEDFLVRAGVVAEGSVAKHKENVVGNVGGGMVITNGMSGVEDFAQGAHWLHQYHQMPGMDQQQNVMEAYMQGRSVPQHLESMYPDSQVNISSSPNVGALSDSHMTGRKRAVSGDMGDKQVERRQKRMIKNRESAARSRARKQAYTNELENKVSRLEEENKRLKKQKELDKIILHYAPPPEPKYRLRRTSSALF